MASSIPAFVEPAVLRWARESIGLTPLAAARKMDLPDDRVRCNSTFCDFSPLTLNGQRYFRKAILPCIRKPMAMRISASGTCAVTCSELTTLPDRRDRSAASTLR